MPQGFGVCVWSLALGFARCELLWVVGLGMHRGRDSCVLIHCYVGAVIWAGCGPKQCSCCCSTVGRLFARQAAICTALPLYGSMEAKRLKKRRKKAKVGAV